MTQRPFELCRTAFMQAVVSLPAILIRDAADKFF